MPSVGIAGQKTARVISIDIFRGLVMVVMIFVNELASVKGLPWWNYHMKANVNAMTYVDMVYPAFLFIVGMAIPLAIRQRLKKNASMPLLWMHVVLRTVSLVVMGLILANARKGDPALMGLSTNAWALLGLLGAVLFWSVYDGPGGLGWLQKARRFAGLALIVAMYAIFRRTMHDGQVGWIDGRYPEILGLIGYTYLAVCILYIPTRRWIWAPVGWFVALTALCAFSTAGWLGLGFTRHVSLYYFPWGNGAMASITMAGVVTSSIFLGGHRWQETRQKLLFGAGFAYVTLVAGWLMTPLGISKIRATPTWCLYSIGSSVLLFMALYWICDVKKKTAWAFFARPAGSNTLLTYLLPDFYYFIVAWMGFTYFDYHYNLGWPGAVRAAVFTAIILAFAWILTKLRVRMQL
jgi:predicted acyltransferase